MIDLPRSRSSTAAVRFGATATVASLLVGLAMVSITSAAAAVSGRGEPDKTIPTLPTTTSPGAVTTEATAPESTSAPATSDAPTSSAEVDTGIALPAGAPITQMFSVANGILAPTVDIAGTLGVLAVIPDGIPTPTDSTIQEFSVHYYGLDSWYRADARFTSTATPDDIAIFYETAMTASGFVLSGDDMQSAEQTRRLEFDNPSSDYTGASVEVLIEGDVDGSITLTIIDQANTNVLAAFNGWALGMPTIEDGVPVEAGLSATRDPAVVLNVSTRFEYDDRSADELTTQIRDAVADGAGGFRIDEENDDGGATIAMTHPVIDVPVATMSGDDPEPTAMVLTGSLTP